MKATNFCTKLQIPCADPSPASQADRDAEVRGTVTALEGHLSIRPQSVRAKSTEKTGLRGDGIEGAQEWPRRVVDLPAESVDALNAHRPRNPETSGNDNFVFCHSDGSHLDPDLVSKWFRRLARIAGLRGLGSMTCDTTMPQPSLPRARQCTLSLLGLAVQASKPPWTPTAT